MSENQINECYITNLHAKNVRLFNELNIEFNKGFNFIVGSNASGKTSILRCLALCITSLNLHDSRYNDLPEVWTDILYNAQKYRMGYIIKIGDKLDDYMSAKFLSSDFPPRDNNIISINSLTGGEPTIQKSKFYCPLFLSAYRKINYGKIKSVAEEPDTLSNRTRYRSHSPLLLMASDLPSVKQWFVNRYFYIDKPWAEQLKPNWDWLIENLNIIAPSPYTLQFKEIKADHEVKLLFNNKEVYLEELSAGFQAVLGMIFAIFEWIEKTNDGENKLANKAVGTVVIDELDAHLHPEWQLNIRNTLETIFPNLQFICTTHSPHIIASAKAGEVIVIPEGHDGYLNLKPSDKSYSGWSTDQILKDIMGVESLGNLKKEKEKLISEALKAYKDNNEVLMKQKINELEKITNHNDTTVTVLKMQIAGKSLGDSCND